MSKFGTDIQLTEKGDTNPDGKQDTNLDNNLETTAVESPFDKLIKSGFTPTVEKKEEKPAEKETASKVETEFYEIPYMKDKDGSQIKVKIPVTERDEYLQKGYNYNKVELERTELKAELLKLAKAAGFDNLKDFNEDNAKKEKAQYVERLEEAAGDPDLIDEIVQSHPDVIKTKEQIRKLDYEKAIGELRKDKYFKDIESQFNEALEANPTAKPEQLSLIFEIVKGRQMNEIIAKEQKSAEERVIADVHDKERRATPQGGDSNDGSEELATPTSTIIEIANAFGVSAKKVAQRMLKSKK